MNTRIQKINELIRKNMDDILLKNLSLKDGVFITIAKIDTTSDLRYTRIFLSIFPESEINYVLKTLEQEIYKMQGYLNKKLHMKPLQRIEFKIDVTESNADKIEKLLKQAGRENLKTKSNN